MKNLLVQGSGRNDRQTKRCLAVFLLTLATGWTAGSSLWAQSSSAVISMSPNGQSQLSWVKPNESTENVAAEEATSEDMFFMEETNEAQEVAIPQTPSPIRPVHLLRDDRAENRVMAAPVAVALSQADDLGSAGSLTPSSTPPKKTALVAENEQRLDDVYEDECPDPHSLSSIKELSYKVTIKPGLKPESCPLPDEVYVRKLPTPIVFTWKASALCHKPLYFEDVQLERYGHTLCPILQPALSGARFWLTIPVLPYLMGVNPPNECVYELGYYRPGSCAPNMINPVPISARGGLMQAGAITGVAYLIP